MLQFLFLGIFLGIIIDKFIFPVFDILLDVFTYAQTEKSSAYQSNVKAKACELIRNYPELQLDQQTQPRELHPAIGFIQSPSDEEEYYEDKN